MTVAVPEQSYRQVWALGPAGAVFGAVLRFCRRYPLSAVGGFLVALFIFLAVFGPLIAPYSATATSPNVLRAPSAAHWFGTDDVGRDLFSRIIIGARTSITVGVAVVAISTAVGMLVGVGAGFLGGWLDAVLMRIIDMIMSFPSLILALAIMAALGPAMQNVIIAVAIGQIPSMSRVIRSQALTVKGLAFVEAGRAAGCSDSWLLRKHVVPNVLPIVIIYATTNLGYAVLAASTLSFLGVGVPPPAPTWGAMVSGQARTYMQQAPWLAIFPILALGLTIAGAAFLGDGLRDALDPRLRGR